MLGCFGRWLPPYLICVGSVSVDLDSVLVFGRHRVENVVGCVQLGYSVVDSLNVFTEGDAVPDAKVFFGQFLFVRASDFVTLGNGLVSAGGWEGFKLR